LAGDLSKSALKNTGNFKNATGEDLLFANRKNKEHIQFQSYAKLFFACNELPISYDNTPGFWRRWLYFEFPYTFVTKEQHMYSEDNSLMRIRNNDILEKLSNEKELSGLLNWGLEGLHRLLKNKKFSSSKTSDEVKHKWIRKSDSLKAFCMDHIEEDYDGRISKKNFRHEYSMYCRKNKLTACNDKYIKNLLAQEYGAVDGKVTIDASQVHAWIGISYKSQEEIIQGSHDIHRNETLLGISNSKANVKPMDKVDKVDNVIEDYVE
jgi:putative DNA primase/helicase